MLIIAQPKSASTSLVSSLAKVMKKSWNQLEFAKNNVGRPASFGPSPIKRDRIYTSLPHSDIIEYNKRELAAMSDHAEIFKQHIPPTQNNINIIKNEKIKCVVVLRRPKDSVEAYRNTSGRKIKNKQDFKNKLKDMSAFYEGYKQIENYPNVKVIYFEDLVINNVDVMRDILSFYGAPKAPDSKLTLDKKRYTGVGVQRLIKERERELEEQRELEKQKELERVALLESQVNASVDNRSSSEGRNDNAKKSLWQKILYWLGIRR